MRDYSQKSKHLNNHFALHPLAVMFLCCELHGLCVRDETILGSQYTSSGRFMHWKTPRQQQKINFALIPGSLLLVYVRVYVCRLHLCLFSLPYSFFFVFEEKLVKFQILPILNFFQGNVKNDNLILLVLGTQKKGLKISLNKQAARKFSIDFLYQITTFSFAFYVYSQLFCTSSSRKTSRCEIYAN
jgi:hypothetical protein